ncbi:hypothetical protein ymoll0001_18740 [Yersinia mollaretii ATCC 43969]|uniref:Uncharacterized protein n=1 Tax=Yersinia mollaretii (strain ATCC 43969 / DSM 18520 / CIP 103324 / CNY 7263 / WAIP 204) TaxID=349967 RepID=A0ABM9Y9M8_YERMW|nr:hypothetical protein ymoll0001_18740 [Yersinia mollaretii ATCC 43969]
MGCSCKYRYFYVIHITVIKLRDNETAVNYFCDVNHKTLSGLMPSQNDQL